MKKKYLKRILLFSLAFLMSKNVYAFDASNYQYRNLCGNFELAGFHTDGNIVQVGCYSTYEAARNDMKNNGINI